MRRDSHSFSSTQCLYGLLLKLFDEVIINRLMYILSLKKMFMLLDICSFILLLYLSLARNKQTRSGMIKPLLHYWNVLCYFQWNWFEMAKYSCGTERFPQCIIVTWCKDSASVFYWTCHGVAKWHVLMLMWVQPLPTLQRHAYEGELMNVLALQLTTSGSKQLD